MLYVPEIEEEYELYIPINKTIGEISLLLCKTVNDISKVFLVKSSACLCNKQTGLIYDKNLLVRETDIKNGSKIILY